MVFFFAYGSPDLAVFLFDDFFVAPGHKKSAGPVSARPALQGPEIAHYSETSNSDPTRI